jgi:hypothetical protein
MAPTFFPLLSISNLAAIAEAGLLNVASLYFLFGSQSFNYIKILTFSTEST